jgi:hypothetical protein
MPAANGHFLTWGIIIVKKVLVALTCVLLIEGCATIMGERAQLIGVNGEPSDASVVITDEKGYTVFRGQTPVTVTLEKSDGSYWVARVTGSRFQSRPIKHRPFL